MKPYFFKRKKLELEAPYNSGYFAIQALNLVHKFTISPRSPLHPAKSCKTDFDNHLINNICRPRDPLRRPRSCTKINKRLNKYLLSFVFQERQIWPILGRIDLTGITAVRSFRFNMAAPPKCVVHGGPTLN